MSSGGRAGGGVSRGRARGPDPQGDLKNCPGPAAAGGARAVEGERDTARRGGEAAGAGGSRRLGWGTRVTVSALRHTCCVRRAHRARRGVPGGAEGRAGAVASVRARAARSGIGVRPGDALRSCSRGWHPGAPGSAQGARSMVVAASGLLPPSCSPLRNAASPGLTTREVISP